MPECNPSDYVRWAEIKDHCEDKHNAMMAWAREVAHNSESDRHETKERVNKLEGFKDKMLWAFIIGCAGIIATNLIGPRLSNGTKEIKDTIAAIESKQARHEQISVQNKMGLNAIMKKLNIPQEE